MILIDDEFVFVKIFLPESFFETNKQKIKFQIYINIVQSVKKSQSKFYKDKI